MFRRYFIHSPQQLGVLSGPGTAQLFPIHVPPPLDSKTHDPLPFLRRTVPFMALIFEYAVDWTDVWCSQRLLVDDFMDQITSITPQVGGGARWRESVVACIRLHSLGDAWASATYLIRTSG